MGRKSSRQLSEKTKKAQRRHRRTRACSLVPRHSQQVRHDTPQFRRSLTSLPPQGTPARYLLPRVALAGLAKPPRTQIARTLPIFIRVETKRSLHKPLPLQTRRKPGFAARFSAASQRLCPGPLAFAVSTASRAEHAAERELQFERFLVESHESELPDEQRLESEQQ